MLCSYICKYSTRRFSPFGGRESILTRQKREEGKTVTDAKMISLLIKLYYNYMGLLCLFLELMQKRGRDSQKEVMGNREGYLIMHRKDQSRTVPD